jgi:hypothetical protein
VGFEISQRRFVAATFGGEISDVTRSYASKGVVREALIECLGLMCLLEENLGTRFPSGVGRLVVGRAGVGNCTYLLFEHALRY